MKRIFSMAVSFCMLTAFILPSSAIAATEKAESVAVLQDEAIETLGDSQDDYSYVDYAAQIDSETAYDNSSIIVSMKKGASDINRVYTAEDFPELDVDYIEDLTYITNEDLLNDESFRGNFTQILQIHLNSPSESEVYEAVELLSARSTVDIDFATPNYVVETLPQSTTVPNDTMYSTYQASYAELIDLPEAWSITTGSSSVKVGVIDTGVIEHSDWGSNLVTGYDSYNENTVTDDLIGDSNHGTTVASVIGAKGNNSLGIAGVCWDVSVVPLQYFSGVSGESYLSDDSDLIQLFTYLNNNAIFIANYSIMSNGYNQNVRNAIANYYGLLVVAAGNNGAEVGNGVVSYPSQYDCDNIISVAGTTVNNGSETLAANSNYSSTYVDIAAPWTAFTISNQVDNTMYFSNSAGTSIAAPYISGVAALIKSVQPGLSNIEVKNLILNNCDTLSSLSGKCVTGGRVNAYKAVSAAAELEQTEPGVLTGDVNGDGYDDIVQVRSNNGKIMLQTYIGYNSGNLGSLVEQESSVNIRHPVTTYTTRTFRDEEVFIGDINGDGRDDIIVNSSSGGYRYFLVFRGKSDGSFYGAVGTSTSNSSNMELYPSHFFVEDYNGDGKDDFLVQYKNSSGTRSHLVYAGQAGGTFAAPVLSESTRAFIESDPVFTADVNGDGIHDVIVHWTNSSGYRQLLVYQGTSTGSFKTPVNYATTNTHNMDLYPSKFLIGDFNGDGYDDFYVHWRNSGQKRCHLLYPGNSSCGFGEGIKVITDNNYINLSTPVFTGDVNGDGIDDVIVQWTSSSTSYRQLRVYTGTSSGIFNASVNFSTGNVHNTTTYPTRQFIADINGDGRSDFIAEWCGYTYKETIYVYKGTAAGSFTSAVASPLLTNFYTYY